MPIDLPVLPERIDRNPVIGQHFQRRFTPPAGIGENDNGLNGKRRLQFEHPIGAEIGVTVPLRRA